MLEFQTTFETVDVKVDDEEYILSEASGAAARLYRDGISKNIAVDADTGKGIGGVPFAKLELELLSRCLKKVDNSGDEPKKVPVAYDVLSLWPDKVLKALIQKLKEMSNMIEDGGMDEEEEGNG